MAKNNPHGLAYDRYLDPPDDDEPPECERCDGSGAAWDDDVDGLFTCPDCNGTGYQPDDRDGFDADDCPPYEGL
jgi:hypothetical protein